MTLKLNFTIHNLKTNILVLDFMGTLNQFRTYSNMNHFSQLNLIHSYQEVSKHTLDLLFLWLKFLSLLKALLKVCLISTNGALSGISS